MPALTFDDLLDQAPSGGVTTIPAQNGRPARVVMDMSQSTPKSSGPLTFDDLIPESGLEKAGRYAEDIGRSALSGVDAGIAGLAGLPADIARGGLYVGNYLQSKIQSRPFEDVQSENDKLLPISRETLQRYGGQAIHARSGLAYKSKTLPGEYAQTIGEFVPNALVPGGAVARAGQVLAPALASETAGQLTKGGPLEGVARFAGALAGGIGAGIASRPATAARAIQEQMPKGVTPQMVDQAEALMTQARQQGIDLAWPEALSQVAQRPILTNTMRHLEASPQTEAQMAEFFARRPQQVEQSARGQFDEIAPVNYAPESVGPNVAATARQFVQDSPEAGILADNLFRAGPRVTPEQAGVTIQNELRNVYDRREGMRAALADQDYTAARGAPATVPLNGGHRVADVTTHYLDRPNVPIILDQAERDAAKAQWLKDNNPTARMPILGERPTQFSQVDAASVVNHIDAALDTAKGSVRQVLQAAKSALMKPGGEVDGSVAGLHNSRVAITDLIDQAKRAGANGAVRELQGVLGVLDRALERVPAYQEARKNFQAASRPLEAFEGNRAPGRIVERDQYNNNFVLPPDRATAAIEQGGPSAARDFNSVATPAAREAFEQNITTQVLDRATREGADLSADSIRQALRQNEDLLRQYPGVRDRLESVAIAREGLAKLEQLPIGKLAKRDLTTKKAVDALFPKNPLPNSQHEIASTVEELAKRSPSVANQLVRIHAESTFNNAAKDLQTGANQAAGAKFRVQLIGNSQQRANLQAAIEALPSGKQRWDGFNKFLDILEATGTRQGIGSRTTYNEQFLKEAAKGGVAGDIVKTGANPLSMGQRFVDRYQQWKLGRNLGQLADILTNPRSENMLRAIARAPNQSAANSLALRLVTSADSARSER